MYRYYLAYHQFLEKYQRFQYTTISFNTLKTHISLVKKWFISPECGGVEDTHATSPRYWEVEPTLKEVKSYEEDTVMEDGGIEDGIEDMVVNEDDGIRNEDE